MDQNDIARALAPNAAQPFNQILLDQAKTRAALGMVAKPFAQPILDAGEWLGGVMSGAVPFQGGQAAQQLGELMLAIWDLTRMLSPATA